MLQHEREIEMAEWSDQYLGMLGHLVSDVSGKIILLRVHQSMMFNRVARLFQRRADIEAHAHDGDRDIIIQQLVSNVSYK